MTCQSTAVADVFATAAFSFNVAPPRTVAVAGDTVTFTGALTATDRTLLDVAPGSGFSTTTSMAFPAGLSAIAETSSSVALTKRGLAALPSSITVLVGRKLVPRRRSV